MTASVIANTINSFCNIYFYLQNS